MQDFDSIIEFIDDNGTTFRKLDYGNKHEYRFTYIDDVTGKEIYDYCDKQQLLDWNVVVVTVIK